VLGYGETYISTTLNFGADPNNKPITAYFRRSFQITDPAQVSRLVGGLNYDDGAVVYLNGHEIDRVVMPTGTITPTTLSPGHEAVGYESRDWSPARQWLVAGTNVLAVEVHQADRTSSDLVFDLSLDVQ
jgi:hypothetical protein